MTTKSFYKSLPSTVVVLALTLATGCATVQVGENFDLDTFKAKAERGVTTQAEVRSWLGAPRGTGVVVETAGAVFDEWTYYSGNGKLQDLNKAAFKMLQVRFDKDGVMRGYSWSGPQKE